MKRSKKPEVTFRSYCLELFKEAPLTGIPPILDSKGCRQTSMKVLILAISLAGFIYQTSEFFNIYWQYSTVESENILKRLTKPAFTICGEASTSAENNPDLSKFENMKQKFVLQPESELVSGEWFDTDLQRRLDKTISISDYKFMRALTKGKWPVPCYILGSKSGGQSYTDEDLKQSLVLRMILRFSPKSEPSVTFSNFFLSFHHPGQLSNPFYQGIRIDAGTRYKVIVSQRDFIRLPAPYSTQCQDYKKDWMENTGKDLLSRQECEKSCEIDTTFETYGCVPKPIVYPHEKNICWDVKLFNATVHGKIQKCILTCKDACSETRYYARSSVIGSKISKEEAKENYGTESVATLDIYFDIFKSKSFVTAPKIESIELLSYIGGYMGMWLGWSLVAIFDMFDFFFKMCRYPFTQRRKKQPKIVPFVIAQYYD